MQQADGKKQSRWMSSGPLAAVLLVWVTLWLLLFLAVPPTRQDFPLHDDWSFSHTASSPSFADRGSATTAWASMPQLGQWLWAWPFVAVLGESHVVLRFATLTLSTLGIVAFYALLRQEDQLSRPRAALAAAALALNPNYFLLSGTYMTDVPSLAFCLIALALYARALGSARVRWLAAATVVAVFAAVNRQNAVMASLAAGAVMAWRYPRCARGRYGYWRSCSPPPPGSRRRPVVGPTNGRAAAAVASPRLRRCRLPLVLHCSHAGAVCHSFAGPTALERFAPGNPGSARSHARLGGGLGGTRGTLPLHLLVPVLG